MVLAAVVETQQVLPPVPPAQPMPPPPPVSQGAFVPLTIAPMPAAPAAQPKKLGRTDSDYARELEEEDIASMSAMEVLTSLCYVLTVCVLLRIVLLLLCESVGNVSRC